MMRGVSGCLSSWIVIISIVQMEFPLGILKQELHWKRAISKSWVLDQLFLLWDHGDVRPTCTAFVAFQINSFDQSFLFYYCEALNGCKAVQRSQSIRYWVVAAFQRRRSKRQHSGKGTSKGRGVGSVRREMNSGMVGEEFFLDYTYLGLVHWECQEIRSE